MAYEKQSRPDSGLGFQVKVAKTFGVDLSSLGSRLGLLVRGEDSGNVT